MKIKGRDLVSGILKTISIDSDEIREAMSDQIDEIVEAIKDALGQTPPELTADLVEKGIWLTGGGALLKNFDKLLYDITGLPTTIAEDPLSSVVMGSEKALDSIDILKHVMH